MRLVTVVLIALLIVIQYPLWWGHGGWLQVHELRQQLNDQLQKNADAKLRNERIAGEVQDLQGGTSAIEERALRNGHGEGRRSVRPIRVAEFAGAGGAGQCVVGDVDARRRVGRADARRAESGVAREAREAARRRQGAQAGARLTGAPLGRCAIKGGRRAPPGMGRGVRAANRQGGSVGRRALPAIEMLRNPIKKRGLSAALLAFLLPAGF